MTVQVELGSELSEQSATLLGQLVAAKVASRIAAKDSSIWGEDAQPEASIRLGWVTSATDSKRYLDEIQALRDHFAASGVTRFVLCGMGGSSLAPEVITGAAGVELITLDSTDPAQVQVATVNLEKTAVVVSSKSGSTVETDSQKRHFEAAFTEVGISPTERIVVVTDPGSPLDGAARAQGYRVFNADPNVGGRYSALTAFGLVPSGLAGVGLQELLAAAESAGTQLALDEISNPALRLAAALAVKPSTGLRDKFGLVSPKAAPGLGDWVEQLVAESTGKEGRGRLPVVLTDSAPELRKVPADMLIVHSDVTNVGPTEVAIQGALGELFITWEYATAILGYILDINPFDQPDVESAKVAARSLLDAPNQAATFDFVADGVAVTAQNVAGTFNSVEQALSALLGNVDPSSSYLSIQAYVSRPQYPQFAALRDSLAHFTGRPVTFGWGPRFLHSTGQYHKGGPRQGIFLQIVAKSDFDLPVPERPFTFGSLIAAQAAGDAKVLADHGDPVLTLYASDLLGLLEKLERALTR